MKHLTTILGIALSLLVSGCAVDEPTNDNNVSGNGNAGPSIEAVEQVKAIFDKPVEGTVTLPQGNDAYPYIQLTKAGQEVADKANAFGIEMFKEVVRQSRNDIDTNVVFSPLSLSMALALTSSGAQGETLAQMARTLGFEGYTSAEIGTYYKTILAAMAASDEKTVISSANAVWALPDLKKAFVEEVEEIYGSKIAKMDFQNHPEQCKDQINAWANEKTNGLIPQFLKQAPAPDTKMLLTNALYFNGKWSSGPYRRQDDKFKDISGNKLAPCKSFFGKDTLTSYFGSDASVIKLPYGNGSFSMVFILPPEDVDFQAYVSQLPADRWEQWMSHMCDHEVYFKIPEFKGSNRFDELRSILQERGMALPCSPFADFGKMCEDDRISLMITDVIQEAVIDVNNTGTEAAAVTLVEMKDSSSGQTFKIYTFTADRPFLYAIVENSHNTLLFIGQHVTVD